eukprot:TRINITY_DN11220_c0_g1_i1.p1 TRINITY_DN11220_c0_g1~~TRINITY_DN11220_c0_g1_i1.p1  ORF type:complete len:563 (+),score=152.98 TRINITY_DN11220_c0_g1_i1:35-1723(+)
MDDFEDYQPFQHVIANKERASHFTELKQTISPAHPLFISSSNLKAPEKYLNDAIAYIDHWKTKGETELVEKLLLTFCNALYASVDIAAKAKQNRQYGYIYSIGNKFGFLTPDGSDQNVIFYEFLPAKKGDRVSFQTKPNAQGQMAYDVKLETGQNGKQEVPDENEAKCYLFLDLLDRCKLPVRRIPWGYLGKQNNVLLKGAIYVYTEKTLRDLSSLLVPLLRDQMFFMNKQGNSPPTKKISPERTTFILIRKSAQGVHDERVINDWDVVFSAFVQPTDQCQLMVKHQYTIERWVIFPKGYEPAINSLPNRLEAEQWGSSNWILSNYIDKTFCRQQSQDNIRPIAESDFFAFNVNLVNQAGDPVFMVLEKNPAGPPTYYFVDFMSGSELKTKFPQLHGLPADLTKSFPLPKWFKQLTDLYFDPELPISVDTMHIFNTNKGRLLTLLNMDEKTAQLWFQQEFVRQTNSLRYNLRLLTPQMFGTDIQMLLPMMLDDENGDKQLALVIPLRREKLANGEMVYKGSTILGPADAYNNARVITRIETNWLIKSFSKNPLKPKDAGFNL